MSHVAWLRGGIVALALGGVLPTISHRWDPTGQLSGVSAHALLSVNREAAGERLPSMAATPSPAPTDAPDSNLTEEDPPFGLPFTDPPGPSTWLLVQAFGNTTFAYRERIRIYDAGQGLHFGIDLAARCGTPVVAIGDGVVDQVDNIYHGAGPHNVVIDHPNGYASLYGHLLARSPLAEGQEIRQGEVVGLSGDPDMTCASRPHLHLEIRNAPWHRKAFNPMVLIKADWDRIALAGSAPLGFEQDLGDPGKWTIWSEQPDVIFGQPLLNDYEFAWPPDW